MVAADRLVPPGAKSPLAIADYAWSPDGARLLIFTNTRRVWRRNTRGDYWVLDLASNSLRKLGGDAEQATLMFAKFSPDGRRVAFVRQNNIYVEDVADGRITALTSDGSRTLINGTFDWVYEEEWSLRDGSPITFAHQLKGNLLLIHGTGDDNCHYQSCEALINKLIEANKPFTMMAYPNRSHSIGEGKNTRQHMFELMTRYLNQNLPPGPRAADENCQ